MNINENKTEEIVSTKENSLMKLTMDNGVQVEFEIEKPLTDTREIAIYNGLRDVDDLLDENAAKIAEINAEIDRLTNHADGLDYTVSVISGIVAGLIDSFFVGEFDLNRGKDKAEELLNKTVEKVAKSFGCKSDNLEGYIRFLEKKFPLASDSNTSDFGGSRQHHLRDFAHHPSIVGLIFSMLTQFTEKAYGVDEKNLFKCVDVKNKALIGKDFGQKILFGSVFWFFHLVSDMAGSSNTPGAGVGLPGPLLSFAKELSVLPIFREIKIGGINISEYISKLFNGTLLAKRDENGKITEAQPFDLRAEIGTVYELGRQAIPVIINECVVRGFYFIRRLYAEIKNNDIRHFKDLKTIEWKNVLPFKNRTIARMLTISTSTFVAFDMADAAIRSSVNGKGVAGFFLRVNFVGVGRMLIAIRTDINMGISRSKARNERIVLMCQQINLNNAKVAYKQAGVWIAAEGTEEDINNMLEIADMSIVASYALSKSIDNSVNSTVSCFDDVRKNNPGLLEELADLFD